jgi:TonB family protein
MPPLSRYTLIPTMFSLLVTSGFPKTSTGNVGLPIVLHRRIGSMPCELVQRGSLAARRQFAWIEIEGVDGDVYSPELGPDDYLAFARSTAGSAAEAARKSGFKVKTNRAEVSDLPAVEATTRGANCPDVNSAIAETEQQRISKRQQLQSKVYAPGLDGISPPSPAGKAEPKADPSTTTSQVAVPTGSESKNIKYHGTVTLAVVIWVDGTIRRIRVTHSSGTELDKKATEEVSRWIFDPARMKGLPVPSEMPIEFTFNLH